MASGIHLGGMSALSIEVPSTANADEHGASMASPSKPSKVYRADYGRLLQEQVNHEKGDAERAEKQIMQMRLDELRESFKERGRTLRNERQRGQELIKSKIDECRQQAKESGENVRMQREVFRAKRQSMSQTWKNHGNTLSKEHADLKAKMRAATEARLAEARASGSEFKSELKELVKNTDDFHYHYKCDLAGRVKAATSKHVTRASKQDFLMDTWDKADLLREQMTRLRQQRLRQEQEYLAYAMMTKEDMRKKNHEAADKLEADLRERSINLRREEKEMKDSVAAAKKNFFDAKKALREQTETNKLVPDAELTDDGESLRESISAAFSRFFGYRRRGIGTSPVAI